MEFSLSKIQERLRAHGLNPKPSQDRHATLRRASILVLLTSDGKILLTQRTLHLRSHPGEVCFPGGKQDEADQGDDWTTALRETKEEVGLDFASPPEELQLERLSCLRTLESINHLCVTPVVGFVNEPSDNLSTRVRINKSEVEQYFFAPLDFFLSTSPVQEYDIPWQGEVFVFRKFMFPLPKTVGTIDKVTELPITGLTAHVAREVAEIALRGTNLTLARTTTGGSKEHQGVLWRLQEYAAGSMVPRSGLAGENSKKLTWISKYFILGDGMLHQYDSRQQAERKSKAALKKNRLKLVDDDSVHVQDISIDEDNKEPMGSEPKFAFRISALDGRIVWHLAASSSHERLHWKHVIAENLIGRASKDE